MPLTDIDRQLLAALDEAEKLLAVDEWHCTDAFSGYSTLLIPEAPRAAGGTSNLYTYHRIVRFIALARNSTRRLLEIIAALETSNNRARELLADCLGNDAAIRDLAKRVLPAAQVDGDSHGVPSVVDVVGMLVEKIEEKP